MVFLVHLRRLIPVILLVLLLTECRPFSAVKEVQEAQKPKRINSPRDEVGSNRKPGTRKGPGLLAGLKIATGGRRLSFTGTEGRGVG